MVLKLKERTEISEDQIQLSRYISAKDYMNKTCEIADRVNGFSGKCTDNCPFADCIEYLSSQERCLILKTKLLLNIISCSDTGMSNENISKLFEIPIKNIYEWTLNKENLKKLLCRYGIVKYLRYNI